MDNSLVLVQFVFRLSFGMAIALGVTSPRLVTSGFFRIHLWVIMGLNTLASLVLFTRQDLSQFWTSPFCWTGILALVATVLSYVGSVVWIYEKPRLGQILMCMVSVVSLVAALLVQWRPEALLLASTLTMLDVVSSGLLMGFILTAMLLGHWYLNTPTMQIGPLNKLLLLLMVIIVLRILICAPGLALEWGINQGHSTSWWLFIALRWLFGLVLTLPLTLMAWQTLKIPNTQSATGILYAALVVVFIGELTSQLLFVQATYPL